MMDTSHSLSSDASEEIIFPVNGEKDRHTFYNLSQMNLLRLGTHLALEGYMDLDEAATRTPRSVSIDEFDQFYKDLRDLGIESEYFDFRKWDTARRRFREANLFLFNSNGDMYLDQTEGFELIVFLGSAKKLSGRYLPEIAGECPGTDHNGLYGSVSVPPDCFRKHFFGDIHRYLDHMPGMLKFYDGLSDGELTRFQDNLMSIATDGLHPKTRVDNIGSEKIATLLHYTEAAFARFDRDRTASLDLAEALAAYQVFRPTFAVLVREKSTFFQTDEDFEALFTYLLNSGTMPAATISGAADFRVWRARRDSWFGWNIHADRGRILEIFAELSKKQ